jgi:predicted phosphodiesterase
LRVAVLYDIHANLPALEAVLAEVDREGPDLIVVGGDVASGPLPVETIHCLRDLGDRARQVMGNTDREMVEAFDTGAGPPRGAASWEMVDRWAAAAISRSQRDFLEGFEPSLSLDVDELGPTLFCHGSPRSDEERITALSPESRLRPMLEGVEERVVICGHTHHQFDRELLGKRVINAGSVGMPYQGAAAAFWLMLGPDVQLRCTDYDVPAAVARMRAGGMPEIDELMLRESLLEPLDPDTVARYFEQQVAGEAD